MRKLIVANWKMNPQTVAQARGLFKSIKKSAMKLKRVETVVCPPHVFLQEIALRRFNLRKRGPRLGAQDVFYEAKGAYMGEVSAGMLKNLSVTYVIIGHSARRALGETDEIVNKKIKTALAAGLKVILCVGENQRDENHAYLEFVKNQIEKDLACVSKKQLNNLILAYEPIWAISSNKNATPDSPDSFLQMAVYIRRIFSDLYGIDSARRLPVIYGGSVNSKNAGEFLRKGMADGLLVGAKSLDAKEFGEILNAGEKN